MKSRKIIIATAMTIFLFLTGCREDGEDYMFTKKDQSTTVKNKEVIVEESMSKEGEETVTKKPNNMENIVDVEKREEPETKVTKKLPETVIPNAKTSKTTTTSKPKEEYVEETTTTTYEESQELPSNYTLDGIQDLPECIQSTVDYWRSLYPNMKIGVGLYSLDGTRGYEYNAYAPINGACTIKAPYAMYVLKSCEAQNIDIWSTYITFLSQHDDTGSGDIMLYGQHGDQYSIGYLLNLMLGISDNVAFNMLLDYFPLNDFYAQNIQLGGENDYAKWGKPTVSQRKNEWIAIYNYINTGSLYSETLRQDLTGTSYCYFIQGMYGWHNYMQKSGWCDSYTYPAAGDCAIIDNNYLLIVLTEDYTTGSGHIDAIQSIGGSVEAFVDASGGYIF